MTDDLALSDYGYGDDPFDGSGYDNDPYQNDAADHGYADPYGDLATGEDVGGDTAAAGGRGEIDQSGKVNINFGDAGGDGG